MQTPQRREAVRRKPATLVTHALAEPSLLLSLTICNDNWRNPMARSTFTYVTYIRTTPEKLWQALTDAAVTQQFWFGMRSESSWKAGSPWHLLFNDGSVCDAGEIIAVEPQRRLLINWQNVVNPEFKAEGTTQCAMELEPSGSAVKLSLTNSMDREHSKYIAAASGVWPKVISNLKSLLETGYPVLEAY